MAKPAHTRVTLRGKIGSGAVHQEDWSFGLNFPPDIIDAAADPALADALAFAVAGWWSTDMKMRFAPEVVLTEARVAEIGPDGKVAKRVDGSYVQGVFEANVPGTGFDGQKLPLQTALCVSLGSERSGPTGKGRFFLPWPAYGLQSDHCMDPAHVTEVMDAVENFITGLKTNLGHSPQIVSSKGYVSEVTRLRIGRAPDTMRSRREDLGEAYKVRDTDFV